MAAENVLIQTYAMFVFLISRLIFSFGNKSKPWISTTTTTNNKGPTTTPLFPNNNKENGYNLRNDSEALEMASSDYGNMVREIPAAVLDPSSINDIANLIKSSNNSSTPFRIAPRGQGHSIRGQAMAQNGVVINMTALKGHRNGTGIVVSGNRTASGSGYYYYADVGGEQLWIDVLHATLEHGLSPVSWTDYLYLTVGGTLSNAGISGTAFRYGPQISNVYELDVITGKGEFVTCSAHKNSELFHAVLGGLGQFGVIVRARIVLESAPKRVKWVRMLYTNFSEFAEDQERLIKMNDRKDKNALDYLEGSLLMNQGTPDNWRSSFFPPSDHPRIISKVTQNKIIYCLEIAKFYDDRSSQSIHKVVKGLTEGLRYEAGFMFEKDVSYVDFLDRVRSGELKLQSQGLWEVPHPWLNLFIPKSRIEEFNAAVFKDIVLKRNITTGPVLLYPMNRNKWDERMSAVIPEDEDVFYTVGFLHSSGFDDWDSFDEQNKEILKFCEDAGIEVKQYLAYHETQEDWIKHFGSKWTTFNQRKLMFDPNKILSPGQKIFTTSVKLIS
ncbi:cytokinin dehydrogenase 3 [Cannabis sativa]|uniref:cytokinin dehydrogenase 3 n=1 Tax=Cannabis sativa TaxID=3483 RepID=UPI0029C9E584|nr:cytokinin dehydrogenase 3 [Cannabis sativa]